MSETEIINLAQTALGIEFGSTRIKAVLIDQNHKPIVSGEHEWENKLVDGIWTYDMEDVWSGLQAAYRELAEKFEVQHKVKLNTVGSIGFSAMMHGYLPFDKEGNQLVPFRWSISHLYQAILNDEAHVGNIDFLTTLAGYVHWQLTGEKVLGVGEAAGMFPIDSKVVNYNQRMIEQFNKLVEEHAYAWKLE